MPDSLAPDMPAVWAEGLLRRLERSFLYVDRLLGRGLPQPLNPFMQTGAVAITALIIATVTGILLLLWYSPSVHNAYPSVAAMSAAPYTTGLVRSLHRYSSDAAMFFIFVHALRIFFERRFAGPRWLAWMTGFLTLGVLWFVGWTGYWLVWDTRAQHIAVGTARVLDVVPIFADPMGRSFLADESVNSLLFFVVFFFHMLFPLAMVFGLWMHLVRISRPHFMTRTPMTLWVLGALLLLSIAYPADNSAPAHMNEVSHTFGMDWWYLFPLVLTDRLTGGALWTVFFMGPAVVGTIPWWMSRRAPKPARVEVSRCNSCLQCYEDCPYEAIEMLPRSDGRDFPMEAHVIDSKCVGCGICSGSCDTIGIGLDWLPVQDQRKQADDWLAKAAADEEPAHMAFMCREAAGGLLSVDPETGLCPELPGYRVMHVPCAGWIHALSVERALRRGGKRVAVVTCGTGDCHYREGADLLNMRLDGERVPMLRTELVDRDLVDVLAIGATNKRGLIDSLAKLRGDAEPRPSAVPGKALAGFTAVVLAVLVAGVVGLFSDLGYTSPPLEGSQLVVTFKHAGRVSENCRQISAEEKASRPVHMRRDEICERRRSAVRLRVTVDGHEILKSAYPPQGVWGDLNSVAVERLPVAPGRREVVVAIGDSADVEEWGHTITESVEFKEGARRVFTFDKLAGFEVH